MGIRYVPSHLIEGGRLAFDRFLQSVGGDWTEVVWTEVAESNEYKSGRRTKVNEKLRECVSSFDIISYRDWCS